VCVCVSLFFGNRASGCNKMFVCSMCESVLVCVCTWRRAFSFLALASSDYLALGRPRDVVRCECAVCWCVCEVCLGVCYFVYLCVWSFLALGRPQNAVRCVCVVCVRVCWCVFDDCLEVCWLCVCACDRFWSREAVGCGMMCVRIMCESVFVCECVCVVVVFGAREASGYSKVRVQSYVICGTWEFVWRV